VFREPPAGKPSAPPAALQAIVDDGVWQRTEPAPVRPQWPFALGSGGSAVLALTNDGASHHVRAGAAMHRARLSAAASGFGTEVITDPRPRAAALPGFPHALLRLG
jgi:hypothetical protein